MKPSQATLFLIAITAFSSALAVETTKKTPTKVTPQAEEDIVELDIVDVVSATPLKGSNVEINKIPTPVQKVSGEQIKKAQIMTTPADYLNQYLGSVHINEAQSNPLQPDIYYRGFVASPVMGMPQGLSMYVNGVRFNEPFGDSVNWDLLPPGAIQSMELHGGSNPVYGLNTLGGAISLRTKTGFDFGKNPQHQFEVSGGSWGRHSEELTSGWNNGTWGYFIDLRNFNEDGWRDHSGTAAKQILGTVSWRNDKANIDVTVASNDNRMKGNGTAPTEMLRDSYTSVFTYPDRTINRMFFSEIAGSYAVTDKIKLSANAYFRQNQMRSYNGDVSNYAPCSFDATLMCDANDVPALDVNNNQIAAPADGTFNAVNNSSQTNMRSAGGSLQGAFSESIFGHKNNLIIGATYNVANVHYAADTELAILSANRGTIGTDILTQADHVRLNTGSNTYSAYFSDNFSITDALTLTVAGRFNHTTLELKNQYLNGGMDNLSGKHSFERFNPSAGLTYQLNPALTFYGNYSESARAPTAMELSCANPNDPCKLPNAFLSDPPLAQVVAKTWETGVRGSLKNLAPKLDGQWNLGYFHTTNFNDIIFHRDGNNLSAGYFSNVGKTQRQGIEAGLSLIYSNLFSAIDDWSFSTNYTYLDARYKTSFVNPDPLDPTQALTVNAGSRLPSLPEHLFKASLGVELWKKASLSINGIYSGAQYLRGDEANSQAKLSGYWLFNLKGDVKINQYFSIFGQVNNLFDHKYNSFGMYSDPTLNGALSYTDRRFVSPSAPRAGWVGIRVSF